MTNFIVLSAFILIVIILTGATIWRQLSQKRQDERINRRYDFISEHPRIWRQINRRYNTGELSDEEYTQIIKMIEDGNDFIV